jgi:hypothetical protein
MNTLKIIVLVVIFVIGIHYLQLLYIDRTPAKTTSLAIQGKIVIEMGNNDSLKYFIFQQENFFEEYNPQTKTKYKEIFKIKRKKDHESDSLYIDPFRKYALVLDFDTIKKVIDLKNSNIVMKVTTPFQLTTPWASEWDSSGNRLAFSMDDSMIQIDPKVIAILDISSKKIKYWRLNNRIFSIAWNPNSKELVVITMSVRLIYCPINLFLIFLGHPLQRESYYITILDLEKGPIAASSILLDTRDFMSGLYWINEK